MTNLPQSWQETVLGAVVEYGKTNKVEPDEIADDTWVLELEDIEKDTSSLLVRVANRDRKVKSTKNRFEADDVLYGKLRPYLNKVLIADSSGVCTTEIIPIDGRGFIDNRFLFYWLKHPRFLDYVNSVSHGVNMPRLGTEAGNAAPIVVAPLPEQKRIADKLDSVLARVEACRERLDRLPALLKRFRQSVLSAATSGRLTEDWRRLHRVQRTSGTETLGSLIAEGPQNGLYKPSSAYGAGMGILRIDMFYDGEVTGWAVMKRLELDDAEKRDYGLSVGDIVVNRVNSPPYVGKSALIRVLPEPCVFESNMMRISLKRARILPEYCIRFLNSPEGLSQLRQNVKHAVNQASINQGDVMAVKVPLPSLDEQHEIVRRVDTLFAFADRLEARYAAARRQVGQLTPALLAKAFRGELVPQDPADEPAAELLKRLAATRSAAPKARRGRKAVG